LDGVQEFLLQKSVGAATPPAITEYIRIFIAFSSIFSKHYDSCSKVACQKDN
jgi:hypothetical protein